MEIFHVIGEKEYSSRLFDILGELVLKEQVYIIKNNIRHPGIEKPVLMYAANFNESERFKQFGDYDHFSFFNDNALAILIANSIPFNKVGQCPEDEAKTNSLMIRNCTFL